MTGYKWEQSSVGGIVPHNAVQGGSDCDGSTIYVGRARHCNDLLPAKIIPSKRAAYVAYGGQEHLKHEYEFLVPANFVWVWCVAGRVPPNAVVCGHTESGETLYTGRVNHNGSLTIGKIQPSHNVLYIPFGGAERSFREFEVLIME